MSEPRKETLADGVEIWLGDCREVLPLIGHVDAVVTDPPYGMGDLLRIGGHAKWPLMRSHGTAWDDEPADVSFIIDLEVPSIIWGGQFFDLPRSRAWLVWDKMMREFSTSVCELAWSNLDQPVKRIYCASAAVVNEGRSHPTQKPIDVMAWCVGFVPNGTVIDPFMGSGTTGVACIQLGRRFIGIEREPKYFDIARRRLESELAKPRLPLDEPAPTMRQPALFDGGAA